MSASTERRRGRRITVWVVLVALLASVAYVFTREPVRLRVAAAAVALDVLEITDVGWLANDVAVSSTRLAGTEVDQYVPHDDAPVVVLVPGAAERGRADPRTVELAQALARRGRTVVVPELEVYHQRLVADDVERIVGVTAQLASIHGPVTLVGFSFGGSLALLAAADAELEDRVALVATFGAYADLVSVAQAAVVGESVVADRRVEWIADPRAAGIVRDEMLRLLPDNARGLLTMALEGELDPDALDAQLRGVYDFLEADTHDEVVEATSRLPAAMTEYLHDVSPVSVTGALDVPIVALHARHDPVIPYAELLRLTHHFPWAHPMELEGFRHVGQQVDEQERSRWRTMIGDGITSWRFALAVLEAGSD